MKTWRHIGVALSVGLLLVTGSAWAQGQTPGTPPAGGVKDTPQRIEGQVVDIDRNQGKVTIRASDGTTHVFQASKETLADLKVGDRIEAQLRSGTISR